MGKAEPFILATGFMSVTGATKLNRCFGNFKAHLVLEDTRASYFVLLSFSSPGKKLAWVAQPRESHQR